MADAAVTTAENQTEAENRTETDEIVFQGSSKNMAVAVAMFVTAGLAFSMSLTDAYFASATAWTFVIWGGLLIYGNLIDVYQSYVVTKDALIIRNPVRFLQATKVWKWENVQRMDVVIKRLDPEYRDAVIQVHYQEPGEIVIEREDRAYDPELARLIIERAGLSASGDTFEDLTQLPKTKGSYTWQ